LVLDIFTSPSHFTGAELKNTPGQNEP